MAHLAEARGVWGPFLVVAPASTLHNWDRELQQFTPGFKVCLSLLFNLSLLLYNAMGSSILHACPSLDIIVKNIFRIVTPISHPTGNLQASCLL
jgi:SNF2 family DNA or RNA helicase